MIDDDSPVTTAPARTGIRRAEAMLTTFLEMGFSVLSFCVFVPYSENWLAEANLIPTWLAKLLAIFAGKIIIGIFVIAVVAGLFLAIYRDRRKGSAASWQKFDYWTTAIVRYFLAYIFLSYGLAKIFRHQFTTPLSVMDTRVADLRGFDLAWRFFAYSYPYTLFIAFSQVLCSLLFFFRRTTTLGAVILMPIIANIVFMNFAYGIPVKLMSCIYLAMTLFLLLPEWRRFKALFWDNTPIGAPTFAVAHFRKSGGVAALKTAVILILIAIPVEQYTRLQSAAIRNPRPLIGTYDVLQYAVNGQVQPASNASTWKRLYIESDNTVDIRSGKLRPFWFYSKFDDAKHTVTLSRRLKEAFLKKAFFVGTYQVKPDGTLTIDGQDSKHDQIGMTLARVKNAAYNSPHT